MSIRHIGEKNDKGDSDPRINKCDLGCDEFPFSLRAIIFTAHMPGLVPVLYVSYGSCSGYFFRAETNFQSVVGYAPQRKKFI